MPKPEMIKQSLTEKEAEDLWYILNKVQWKPYLNDLSTDEQKLIKRLLGE